MATKEKFDIYKDVTRRIVMSLAQGEIPWRQRWCSPVNIKVNYVSRRPYSGINLLLLRDMGEYLTFNQCDSLGGHIKKGEHAKTIYTWFPFVRKEDKEEYERRKKAGENTDDLTIPVLRFNKVFHLSQTEGIKTKIETPENEQAGKPVDIAEWILSRYGEDTGITIKEKQADTCTFDSSTGILTVPSRGQFRKEEQWYGTVFQQLALAMAEGAQAKDAEKKTNPAMAELVAEIAASMVMTGVGLDIQQTREDTLAACSRWSRELEADARLVVTASGRAQKIAEHILQPLL